MTPEPVLIVADNYELAHHYAREHDLGRERRDWIYVSQPCQAFGRRNGRYATVTLGRLNPLQLEARLEVLEILRRNGFERL